MIANRAWGALGAAAVFATAATGCDRAANGHARAQRAAALQAAVVADDESGVDAAEDLTGTPEPEAPEADLPETEGVPPVEDAGSPGDEIPSSDDAGGIIFFIDAVAPPPPVETPEASVESGGSPESGSVAPVPTAPEAGRETGAPHGSGVPVHVPTNENSSPSIIGDPTFSDDSSPPSSWGDAGSVWGSAPSDNGGSPNLDVSPSHAVIGCAGCSVPDAAAPGALAWLMVALTAGVRIWRRRR
jgi:MYXO-CTERM domain-containing protein